MSNRQKLKTPEGVGPHGVINDMESAYSELVGAFYEQLERIGVVLEDISGSLSVIALLAEKWGVNQTLISEEDIDDALGSDKEEEEDKPDVPK